jgi:hypothetical protein
MAARCGSHIAPSPAKGAFAWSGDAKKLSSNDSFGKKKRPEIL